MVTDGGGTVTDEGWRVINGGGRLTNGGWKKKENTYPLQNTRQTGSQPKSHNTVIGHNQRPPQGGPLHCTRVAHVQRYFWNVPF